MDTPRRSGGRQARLAERQKSQQQSPLKPGLLGGRYRPLLESELARIFGCAKDLLETLGMADAIPVCREVVCDAGGWLSGEGRLHIPGSLVEETIGKAAKSFALPGFDPRHDLEIGGARVHFGTGGAAVHILDSVTRQFRESTLLDLYDLACLAHHFESLHFFLRPIVARDMETPRDLDINTAYAVMSATDKPVASSFFAPEHVHEVVQIAEAMLGAEGAYAKRPFLHAANTFVVPPLKFAQESCECLVAQVEVGMPIMLVSAGQAGATSPAALAGALAQGLAECLAGLVFVNLLKPGHPTTLGLWPFVSDLRSGAMSGGSGEEALLTAASAQLVNWLGLPSAVPAGMTDAKEPDNQAGYEKGITVSLTAAAGGNMIYESGSMLASILSSSKEAFLIDSDMLTMINRTVGGIEVTDDSLSFETIREAIEGPGHFLGSAQTLALMQREYVYPRLADRSSPKEWAEKGRPALLERAHEGVRAILGDYRPIHVPLSVHEEIRRRHPIRLPLEEIAGTSSRWR